jgi:drug/metabolite transporter (DMT)-like permease
MNDKRQATAAEHADWRGEARDLAGVAVFRVTLPATRLAVQQIDPWAVAFGRMADRPPGLVGIGWALVLALPVVLLRPQVNWSADAGASAVFLYVAVGSQCLGFYFWYNGRAPGAIARIGRIHLRQTFLTLGCSAMLLGARIDKFTLIFALATVLCVWAGRRARA